ncbi:major facilitator superfamily domain-containing protein [Boletus edulis]|uniref:Major facilitator superfamily domain-containing protein n=1 Tax=Boletus edulis BED1 TaxID=1328754 RepID=A0AAD4G5B7_BOLED|nr:major facilitator superfamily domain-containing protein [Boletus edulis]KAF8415675.1 major facilitator superfamily domain-containing protein [Boletus edulis BED1]
MEVNNKSPAQSNNVSRIITLLGSVLVALSSGTNYIYSAYAPQLGARLRVSHTQQNIIGLAGNMGVYTSGPVWGRIVDHKGPRIPLIGASICLLVGYLGIKRMYDDGIGNAATVSPLHLALLVVCSFMTGLGGNAGLGAAMNTTAKSFPPSARATTTGLVLSGFGLSAFWFSLLAHTLFPGNTSAFLSILALGTAFPMIIGLFIIKPVPLHPTSSHTMVEGYDAIPTGEGIVFVGETQAVMDSEADVDADADSAPLLPHEHEQETSSYQASLPTSAVELNPPVHVHRERSVGDKDALPDIHGKRLWLTPDFYLVFMIMAICSGTGLMYINNVGSISQALYAKTHTVYDDVEAAKWQAAQVSILSLGNFAGRILIGEVCATPSLALTNYVQGLISDFGHIRLRIPRAYCLCIVSSLFIVSQATAMTVSSVETLWVATLLLGLAYGFLFGSCPTIMIEWFGMAHFSENWGYLSFSPVLGGNLFSLMFGRYLDAHVPVQDTRSSLGTRVLSIISLGSRDLPSEHQCFDGKACYLGTLQVTLVACIISLGLSWRAGIRDGQKIKARDASVGV